MCRFVRDRVRLDTELSSGVAFDANGSAARDGQLCRDDGASVPANCATSAATAAANDVRPDTDAKGADPRRRVCDAATADVRCSGARCATFGWCDSGTVAGLWRLFERLSRPVRRELLERFFAPPPPPPLRPTAPVSTPVCAELPLTMSSSLEPTGGGC